MTYRRNGNITKGIFALSVCFTIVLSAYNRWGYKGNCVLCNSCPYHEPCIISLSTGNIIPLTVYDPHPFSAGELAEEQTDGYASLIHQPGFSGYRDTNSRKIIGKVHAGNADPLRRAFCCSCRKVLAGFSQIGFVIADLQRPNTPAFFPLKAGMTLTLRCYEVAVTLGEKENTYCISVQGILEQAS